MWFDEHGHPQLEEPDFRDALLEQIDAEEAALDRALEHELEIDAEVQRRANEMVRGAFYRFLCIVDSPIALDCARLALGFPMAPGVSGETIARKHGVTREAIRKRKRQVQQDLGLPQSFFDRPTQPKGRSKPKPNRKSK